jgi:hypothetical protein
VPQLRDIARDGRRLVTYRHWYLPGVGCLLDPGMTLSRPC